MSKFQDQRDDVLAAISEGVVDPSAEFLPMVVLVDDGMGRYEISIDEKYHKVVEADSIRDTPLREISRSLGMKSDAIEVKPSVEGTRVGILLPPHTSMLPGKALWKSKSSKNKCYLVLEYRPMVGILSMARFSWESGDEVKTLKFNETIKGWLRLVKRGKVSVFELDKDPHPAGLKDALKPFGG